MTAATDPVYRKYFQLKSTDMPMDQIKLQMEADGVDPVLLDRPDAVSPNDRGVRCNALASGGDGSISHVF